MLVEKVNIEKEFYLAILMDRTHNGPVVLASTEGGMDIETVAATNPDAIVTHPVSLADGFTLDDALGLANKLGLGDSAQEAAEQIVKLYNLFIENDATSIEINPLGLLADGKMCFLDAKFNFDDNAQYRNKELFEMRDSSQVRHTTAPISSSVRPSCNPLAQPPRRRCGRSLLGFVGDSSTPHFDTTQPLVRKTHWTWLLTRPT
jgi:succinyl-CoA synthetase beta subunit